MALPQEVIDLADSLKTTPKSWDDMTAQEQQTMRLVFEHTNGFSSDQFAFLRQWWFAVTQSQVNAANQLMPANHVIVPREDTGGNLWVSIDILSDILQGRLSALLNALKSRHFTYKPSTDWPAL